MNTAFTRLLWKEFRAQRMLWTVLSFGWLLIHSLYLWNGESVLDFMPIIIIIPVCFIVAAAMIAFAGEDDEKTANLLRMLPVPTSTLMSAKTIAILSGVLTLCLAMTVLSFSVELIVSSVVYVAALLFDRPAEFLFPFVPPRFDAFQWEDGEAFYIPAFLALVFATSVVCSMCTRRMFSAVGLTVAMIMGIMFTAFSITSNTGPHQQRVLAPWIAGIAVILTVVSRLLLSQPWHFGHLPPRWQTPEVAGNFAIRGIPSFAGLWQSWLQRIVAQQLTMSRILNMLVWRECRTAVLFAVTWLTIGIVICAGRYFSSVSYPWPFLFLVIFIHECGQRTMREDQRTGSISLLANIGVHPLQVWISKTFVWLLVMCVVGIAVIAIDNSDLALGISQSTPTVQFRVSTIVGGIRVPQWGQQYNPQKTPSTSADLWLQASVCFALILGLFSLGQLTACWIQRQTIAFAASLIGGFASASLFSLVIFGDLPAWVTLVPIPFCFLLATAATARNWIDRRATWRLRLSQLAMVVIPFVVFPILGSYAWQWQPQLALNSLSMETGLEFSVIGNPQNSNNRPEIARLIAMANTPPEKWKELDKPAETKCWFEFATALKRHPLLSAATEQDARIGIQNLNYDRPLMLSQSAHLGESPAVIRGLLKPFDEILAKDNTFPPLPVAWTAPWSNTPAIALSFLLLEDARHREANGDIAGAVDQIIRTIRVDRSLAMQTSSWANWLACLAAERVALGRMRILLGTADLSASDLDRLLAELTSVLVMDQRDGNTTIPWQDPRMMLQRRTLFWRDALYRGPFTKQLQGIPPVQQVFEVEDVSRRNQYVLRELEGSRAERACYTMMFSESLLVSKYNSMTISGKIGFLAEPKTERIQQLRRFIATSNMADLHADAFAVGNETDFTMLNPHIDTIASERATLLTIMLQKYRIAHGKFPESLLDLPDAGAADDFIRTDPWTGAVFFYAAPNHATALRLRNVGDSPAFTPGQPLLFTPGAIPGMLNTYISHPTGNGPFEMLKLPENVILFLGLSDVVDWRYEQIASKVTVQSNINAEPVTPSRD